MILLRLSSKPASALSVQELSVCKLLDRSSVETRSAHIRRHGCLVASLACLHSWQSARTVGSTQESVATVYRLLGSRQ